MSALNLLATFGTTKPTGGGGGGYTHYRLLITEWVNTDGWGSINTIELRASVSGANLAIDGTTGTASSSGTHPSEPASRAFDGLDYTRPLLDSSKSPCYLQFELDTPSSVAEYGVGGGISAEGGSGPMRSPKAWKLQGSSDGSAWDDLDIVSGQTGWSNNTVRYFTL